MADRFVQLVSERMQLMRKVVRRRTDRSGESTHERAHRLLGNTVSREEDVTRFYRWCGTLHRRALLGLSVLNLGLLACADGSPSNRDTYVLRDSAGIQIAENAAPTGNDAEAWVVDSVPSVRIGGEVEDSVPLVGVTRARMLADGRIVVALGRRGINELLLFGSHGGFERVIGCSGEGPGEVSRVVDLYRCGGDTLVVNEYMRLSFFNSEGEFVRTTRVRQADDGAMLWPYGISSDCSQLLVMPRSQETPRHGTVGTVHTTLMWSALHETRVNTIATVPHRRVFNRIVPGWDDLLVYVPWGQLLSWTVGELGLIVGTTGTPELRVFDNDGSLAQITRWVEPTSPVTSSDRQLFVERWERTHAKFPELQDVYPPIDEFPEIPTAKPLFHTLLSDDEGNIWVRRYPDFVAGWPESYDVGEQAWDAEDVGEEIGTWRVFDKEGRFLSMVGIPAKHHVLAIERGYVIALTTDELGIEAVNLYELQKSSGR